MKHLALDIGNVISHVNLDRMIYHLSKTLNVSLNDSTLFLNKIQKEHDLGLTTLADELHIKFNIKSEVIIQEILNEWNACVVPDQDVIRSIELLQSKHGFEIALLSNIGAEHAKHLRENFAPKHSIFSKSIQFFSCDVGARKPSFVYYQTFLSMYPQFQGCLYLDDLTENINTSKIFGMNAKQFDLSSYKKSYLDNLLVGGGKINCYFEKLSSFWEEDKIK